MTYQEGLYKALILEAALGTSSGNNPQIVLKVDILGMVDTLEDGTEDAIACEAGVRTLYLTLTEKSADMHIKNLREAGWEDSDFSKISTIIGKECYVNCKQETQTTGDYAGQVRDRFELGKPYEAKPLEHDPSVAMRLNALFGKKLKGAKPTAAAGKTAAKTPAKEPAQQMADSEDDLPF